MKTPMTWLAAAAVALLFPLQCAHAESIKANRVVTGTSHACALLDDGNVKCWGANGYGQLGQGDNVARGTGSGQMGDDLPAVDLDAPDSVTQIVAGGNHTCAMLYKGAVKCWGANDHGQLGLGDVDNRGDYAGEMGADLPYVYLGTGRVATKIAAGGAHTCALLDDGRVKCWGLNASGQLGQGTRFDRGNDALEMGEYLTAADLGTGRSAVQLTAGFSHTCALLDDATVKCWGDNYYGQLGLGDKLNRGGNPNEMGDYLPAVALGTGRTAVHVVAGAFHTCALLDDASVKCWGLNDSGQLGLGDEEARGDDANEMGDYLPAVSLGFALSPVTRIAAGHYHSCALLGTHLKCWGRNTYGQLGLGDQDDRGDGATEMGAFLQNVELGTNRHAVQVSGGWHFSCARLNNQRIKCWGDNFEGQLGLGDNYLRGVNPGEMGDALPAVDLGTR